MQDKNDWAPFARDCSLFFKVSRETQKATKIIKSYECLVVTDLGTVFN